MRSQPSGVEPERSTKIIGDFTCFELAQNDKLSVNSHPSNLRYLSNWPIGRRKACSSPWHAVDAGCKMIKMLRYESCETLMMIMMSIWLQNLRTVWTIATLCLDRLEVRTVRLSAAKTLQSHNMPKGIDRSMRWMHSTTAQSPLT